MIITDRWGITLLLAVAIALLGSGCASVSVKTYKSGRNGLLDRLQEKRRGWAAREVKQDRPQVDFKSARLQWPLARREISSSFGERGSSYHEGIDLRASDGTPVYAADDGKVLYAGNRISGYGNMIIVRHSGKAKGLSTIYAHNSRLLVRVGQDVKRGQRLALSGHTGKAKGPHLHFEVRQGVTAIDPLIALPPVPNGPKASTLASRPHQSEAKIKRRTVASSRKAGVSRSSRRR